MTRNLSRYLILALLGVSLSANAPVLHNLADPFGCCGEFTGGFTGNTDCDTDGKRNIVDVTQLIDRVYLTKTPLCCEENGNTDGDIDGKLNIADITRLIDNIYLSKAETAACEDGPINTAPVANAGFDHDAVVGSVVQLDGSLSTDADGDSLHYVWEFVSRPPGSSTWISRYYIVNPTFHTDVEGSYVVGLRVHDGLLYSDTSFVTITASISSFLPMEIDLPISSVEGIWGSHSNNVYVVGWGYDDDVVKIFNYDGNTWTEVSIPPNYPRDYRAYDVWGSSENDIFVVGDYSFAGGPWEGNVFHYDGSSWSEQNMGGFGLRGVWGTSDSDVFVVGVEGRVYHWRGPQLGWEGMSGQFPPGANLVDVWGSSPTDVYTLSPGYNMSIIHYDGVSWDYILPGWGGSCIWGTSSTNIFIGVGEYIIHYDGSVLSYMTYPEPSFRISDIHGNAPDNVYAVGSDERIIHYNGNIWSVVHPNPNSTINIDLKAVWVSSTGEVFAVTGLGTILHSQ